MSSDDDGDDDGDDDIGDNNDDNDDRTGQPVEVERTAFIAFIEKEQVRGVHCIFKFLYLTSNIMVRGVYCIQDVLQFHLCDFGCHLGLPILIIHLLMALLYLTLL